ncbi:MAG: sigma-70 family RNA polymerase sigma factor [Sphingobacterium sp.]|jgi:RNA polymerase sigma-70 factor (ECF subfamily)|nr:sigma-70 family RNA polymerase sigma factor [Sphingobacterium sp.]
MKNDLQYIHEASRSQSEEIDFEEIYIQNWERIYKQVIRIIPEEQEAIDIVQQTFTDLWEIRAKIPQIKSLRSFLFIMARNLSFRRLRDILKNEKNLDSYASHYCKHNSAVDQELDFKELNTMIQSHIDLLPDKMKTIFLMSRKSHLSYLEIAKELNISDKTVKKQISNAIKILKTKIDKEYIPYLMVLILLDTL